MRIVNYTPKTGTNYYFFGVGIKSRFLFIINFFLVLKNIFSFKFFWFFFLGFWNFFWFWFIYVKKSLNLSLTFFPSLIPNDSHLFPPIVSKRDKKWVSGPVTRLGITLGISSHYSYFTIFWMTVTARSTPNIPYFPESINFLI